jgi:hypothetical protein
MELEEEQKDENTASLLTKRDTIEALYIKAQDMIYNLLQNN